MNEFRFTDHLECLVMSSAHFDLESKLVLHQHSLNDHKDVRKIGAVMKAVHQQLARLYYSFSFDLYSIAFWITLCHTLFYAYWKMRFFSPLKINSSWKKNYFYCSTFYVLIDDSFFLLIKCTKIWSDLQVNNMYYVCNSKFPGGDLLP